MAQQTINVGTAPNDGTGDTLKASFTKCNANFTELYTASASFGNVLNSGTPVLDDVAQWVDATHIKGVALSVWRTTAAFLGSTSFRNTAGGDGLNINGAANQGQIVAAGASPDIGLVLTSKGNAGVTFYNANFARFCASFTSAPGSNTFINFVANVNISSMANNPAANPIYVGSPLQLGDGASTAVTQSLGDNSTKIATTAFVLANSPTKIGFSAFPSANQTGIADQVWTKVQFASTVYNDSTLYNTTTHRWTPPAGRCQLSASVYFTAGVLIGTPFFIGIYKNGTMRRHTLGACVSSGQSGAAITMMDVCSGTDYFEVFVLVYSGATATLDASAGAMGTWFMGTTL